MQNIRKYPNMYKIVKYSGCESFLLLDFIYIKCGLSSSFRNRYHEIFPDTATVPFVYH
jgi:hypothetical protein